MTTDNILETPVKRYLIGDDGSKWGLPRKIGFRFLFCYIVLFGMFFLNIIYMLTMSHFNNNQFPPSPFDGFWGVVIPWMARYLFHLPPTYVYRPIDSGDSVNDYLELLASLFIAAVATGVWSLLERNRPNYARLNQWLRLYAQLVLASVMFLYGFDKVLPLQFRELTTSRLSVPVGDLDHFSMLWIFMASSKPYTIFSGALEVLAGVLLLMPKLRSLGAFLAAIVMTNVFVLNIFYDVTVKLFSLEFLLLAIFLAAPELPRLYRMLVLNQTIEPRRQVTLSEKQRVARWAYIVQGVIGACIFLVELVSCTIAYEGIAVASAQTPFHGTWVVDEFKVLSNARAPLLTDKLAAEYGLKAGEDQWAKLSFERPGFAVIHFKNGKGDGVAITFSKDKRHFVLFDDDDPKWKIQLAFQQPDKKSLILQGQVNGAPIEAKLHLDDHRFNLTNDEYHFIR